MPTRRGAAIFDYKRGCVGRVLGLDVGERRIGVAISDPERRLAVPFRIVERREDASDVQTIVDLARDEKVEALVIGHPITLKGTVGPQARQVEAFAERLAEASGLPLELWDERLTTVQAQRSLTGARKRRGGPSRSRSRVDDVAAAIMLQSYLDRHRAR